MDNTNGMYNLEGVSGNELARLEEEDAIKSAQLSIEQKNALIREARKRYGSDWRKIFAGIHSGLDWSKLKFTLKQ